MNNCTHDFTYADEHGTRPATTCSKCKVSVFDYVKELESELDRAYEDRDQWIERAGGLQLDDAKEQQEA